MKRSEINAIIKEAIEFLNEHKFVLPFATAMPIIPTIKRYMPRR